MKLSLYWFLVNSTSLHIRFHIFKFQKHLHLLFICVNFIIHINNITHFITFHCYIYWKWPHAMVWDTVRNDLMDSIDFCRWVQWNSMTFFFEFKNSDHGYIGMIIVIINIMNIINIVVIKCSYYSGLVFC